MNKYTTPIQSSLLINKLSQSLTRLQAQVNPTGSNIATVEDALAASTKILSEFYKNLSKTNFNPALAIVDTIPSKEDYENNFSYIEDDLGIIFLELENMEDIVLQNFNYMVSKLNKLHGKLKAVSSNLGDYILYSTLPTKDAIFFGDSFTNISKIEVNSPLLNNTQCEISQEEGIITLPVDRPNQVPITITDLPAINSNSNGVVGNNQEQSTSLRGDISTILDNNPDTWFEYERVPSTDDGIPLVLDLTINLTDEKVLNFIRINPNNFGTRTQINIVQIDTSTNGKDFISIKDDISIAGYITVDEDNIFLLAPSTSKYAGQGLYTFTPRYAKYIRLVLKQTTPYPILTSSGIKSRYAIGIRDIEVAALPFISKGEFISKEYTSIDEIKKVVLLSNQNPDPSTSSKLASIEHFVSPDNGITWLAIRPKVSEGIANTTQTIPELIDFNGVGSSSVATSNSVYKLRYKAVMSRDTTAFSSSSAELAQEKLKTTELHAPPTTTPFIINLQQTPIDNTLKLVDTNYGSRGFEDNPYLIGVGNGTKQRIHLPIPLKKDYQKILSSFTMGAGGAGTQQAWTLSQHQPQTIYIDGEVWTAELGPSSTPTDKHYRIDFEKAILEMGDGTIGKAVPAASTISMLLDEERLYPGIGENHIAKLDYATVADQGQVEIYLVGEEIGKTVLLKNGATSHQLDPYITSTWPIFFSDLVIFTGNSKDHPAEVITTGDWYINKDTGYLVHYTAIPADIKVSASYFYTSRIKLAEDDWDFTDIDGGISNAVSINDKAYKTFFVNAYPELIPAGVNYINLSKLAVVPGSLTFTTPSGLLYSGVYGIEVPYIDGRTELQGVVHTKQAISSMIGIIGDTTITKDFNLPVSNDTSLDILFSNQNIFTLNVSPAAPSNVGEYNIDLPNRQFYVRVSSDVVEPGYVSYYYDDPQANVESRYSVKSNTGEVFLHEKTGAADTLTYQYTNYIIRYPIARAVEPTDWTFDKKTNKITIKDREILKNIRQPQGPGPGLQSLSKFYQVSYQYVSKDRDNILELEPYFSPILRDYAAKIITASRLI